MTFSLWTPSRRGLLLGAGAAAAAPAAFAGAPALLTGVRVAAAGDGARALLALNRPAQARTFFLSGPDRFVIDLPDVRPALGAGAGEGPGAGLVQRYRYAARPDGSARVVLDLTGPARLGTQTIGSARAPGLSFELTAAGGGPIPLQAEAAPAAGATLSGRRRVVVIDPGHGGHDPGAVGVTGVREKDVVLDAALKLRDSLEARGRYRVELTRDADAFIPLPERVRFARARQADLFVSLHADANANHEAAGASVYTLSENGSDRARSLMASQDWSIDTGDAPRAGVVNDILVDLTQRETSNRSAAFAQTLISDLQGSTPLLNNTHRNAGFFVLLAPDVPAVLLEMGFLTNAADERRLSDGRERARMAEALGDAVDHYFAAPRTYMARA
ncbi:MAG: N-acetylmuramoyl-L-alanine amidase [Hyphomonadaceae bacterium]